MPHAQRFASCCAARRCGSRCRKAPTKPCSDGSNECQSPRHLSPDVAMSYVGDFLQGELAKTIGSTSGPPFEAKRKFRPVAPLDIQSKPSARGESWPHCTLAVDRHNSVHYSVYRSVRSGVQNTAVLVPRPERLSGEPLARFWAVSGRAAGGHRPYYQDPIPARLRQRAQASPL